MIFSYNWYYLLFSTPARYQNNYPQNAAAAENFQFSTSDGLARHTKGEWFTVLQFHRARDNVLCNILLVDSEGTGDMLRDENFHPGGTAFSAMLFALASMQAQVLMAQFDPGNSVHNRFLQAYQSHLERVLSSLPADVRALPSVTNVKSMILLRVGRFFFHVITLTGDGNGVMCIGRTREGDRYCKRY